MSVYVDTSPLYIQIDFQSDHVRRLKTHVGRQDYSGVSAGIQGLVTPIPIRPVDPSATGIKNET